MNGGADYLDDVIEKLTKYKYDVILYIHKYKNIRCYNILKIQRLYKYFTTAFTWAIYL
jgi:hypothetical protein